MPGPGIDDVEGPALGGSLPPGEPSAVGEGGSPFKLGREGPPPSGTRPHLPRCGRLLAMSRHVLAAQSAVPAPVSNHFRGQDRS